MRALALASLALLATACGGPPRCVVEVERAEVFVYGETAPSCTEVADAFTAALRVLRVPLPALRMPKTSSVTFHEGRYFPVADGTLLGGQAWCGPFEMDLGDGRLRTAESSLVHELTHWAVGMEQGLADCGQSDGEGGHRGWVERGVYPAMQLWDEGE